MGDVSKLPVNGFKWVENLLEFNEDFIKKYDEDSNTGYFPEVDVEYPKNLFNSHKDLHFYPKNKKLKKYKSLFAIQMTKKTMSII